MAIHPGALVLIKTGDGGTPEQFSTVGGLRASRLLLGNETFDASTIAAGPWRKLAAGMRTLRIEGDGIFTASAGETALRLAAFSGSAGNYRFQFGNGAAVTGAFLITRYERAGRHDDAEVYSMAMESAGALTYA